MSLPQPERGHVYFYDHARPPLEAGDYELRLNQRYEHATGTRDVASQTSQSFTITGPRFTLNPADIHSVYPPANARGPFEGKLPQIVLTRRTLPWERSIDPSASTGNWQKDAPWLALLVFEEDEVTLLDPPDCTAGMIYNRNNEGYIEKYEPSNVKSSDYSRGCLGVEVAYSTFRQVAPLGDELAYLTHVRQVNTDDKELLGLDKDGWFAVVIANRLPERGKKYVACLVSLEGLASKLPTEADFTDDANPDDDNTGGGGGGGFAGQWKAVPSVHYTKSNYALQGGEISYTLPTQKIRLLTLARWQFELSDVPGDFESLLVNLPNRGGVAMLGMNQAAATTELASNPSYQVALDSGHVPLKHVTREGETTVAWYRGPLVPVGISKDNNGPYHTSDQARRVDPNTGLENLGYAAAFEIGRLMALADPRFALELLRWRRGGYRQVARRIFDVGVAVDVRDILDEFLARHIVDRMLDTIYRDILGPAPIINPSDITGLRGLPTNLVPGLDPAIQLDMGEAGVLRMSDVLNVGGSLEGGGIFIDPLGAGVALDLEAELNTLATEDALNAMNHLRSGLNDILGPGGGL